MKKKLMMTIFASMAAMSVLAGNFKVSGSIAGLPDGTKLILSPMSYAKEKPIATTTIQNGKFAFSGSVPAPMCVNLMVDESYGYIQMMVDDETATVKGGMFGTGLGRGYTADFVPVCTSDYVYAAICEEFGMIFGIGVMLLFFLLFYRGIRGAFITKNRFSQLVAVGLSCMIAFQTLVIIGGIFAVIPLTGITLPFVSYGGSSMLTIFFALGVLQKVSEEA